MERIHRAHLDTDPAALAVDRVPDHLFGLLVEVPAGVRTVGEAVQAGRALFMIDDGTIGPPVPGLHHRLLAYGAGTTAPSAISRCFGIRNFSQYIGLIL